MDNLSFMLMLKIIIFLLILISVYFFSGKLASKVLRLNCDGFELFGIGFLVQIAIVHLIGWPFMAFRLSTQVFCAIVITISLFGLVFGFLCFQRDKGRLSFDKSDLVYLGIIILEIILVFIFYRSDADDSFYVSNIALFKDSSFLNLYDSSFGNQNLGTVPIYDFETWEAYLAVFCRIFNIEAATMAHFALLPLLLLISASAYAFFARSLFRNNRRDSTLFFLFVSIFYLMGGYSVFSQGSFLLSRLWQGKAVYLHVVLPIMTALMILTIHGEKKKITLLSSNGSTRLWLALAICSLAGVSLNPTSIFVLSFQLVALSSVLVITTKNIKFVLKSIPALIIFLFFLILMYIRNAQYNTQTVPSPAAEISYVYDTFLSFFSYGIGYFFLYLIAIVIIMVMGHQRGKLVFIYAPLVLFLLAWNPITGNIIALVTKHHVYWRLFWLMPVGTGISYALVLLSEKISRSSFQKSIIIVICTLLIILPGSWMFSEKNGFILAKNVERLPEETILFGDKMISRKEAPVLLSIEEIGTTFRQKYTKIELIYSRYQYLSDLFISRGEETDAQNRLELAEFANGNYNDSSRILEHLDNYHVDYIVLHTTNSNGIALLEGGGWRTLSQSEQYILLERYSAI